MDLSHWAATAGVKGKIWPGDRKKNSHPAALRFAGSRRRSGCVPAEPYPPLEQSQCFPFPLPRGSIGGTGHIFEKCIVKALYAQLTLKNPSKTLGCGLCM